MVKYSNYAFRQVDVEDIMGSINNYLILGDQSSFKENLYSYDLNAALKIYEEQLRCTNELYQISLTREIVSSGKFRRIKNFVKKVIRKTILWYIRDIEEQQVTFNAHVVRTINMERELIHYLVAKDEEIQKNSIEMAATLSEMGVKGEE